MDLVLRCDRLYEGRIASLQRAVAMFVMFHELGKRVQDFVSCHLLHVRVLVRVHLSHIRADRPGRASFDNRPAGTERAYVRACADCCSGPPGPWDT